MKLWPTTIENKCFVKMLWHLLVEYFCTVATVPSSIVAIVPNLFYFILVICLFLCFFFPFKYLCKLVYILLYWHNKFYNIFTIIDVSISYKSK